MSTKMNRDQEDKARAQAAEQIKALPEYTNRNKLFVEGLGLHFTGSTKMLTYAPFNKEKRYLVEVESLDAMFKGDRRGVEIHLKAEEISKTSVTFKGTLSYIALLREFANIPTDNPELFVSVCSSFIFTHNKAGDVVEALALDFEDWRQSPFESCLALDGGASILVVSDVATVLIRNGVISLIGAEGEHHTIDSKDRRCYSIKVETTVALGEIEAVIDYNKNPDAMNKLFAEHMGGIKLTETTQCLGEGKRISDMPLVLAKEFDWSHTAEYIKHNHEMDTTTLPEGRVLHAFCNSAAVCDADKNVLLYIPVYELHGAEFNEKTGTVIIHGHETIHSFKSDDFSTMSMMFTR